MKNFLTALFVALIMIPAALAAVDVSYTFTNPSSAQVLNVSGSVYNCLDSSCSQVGTFGGSVFDPAGQGQRNFNVTDGTIGIRYPHTLNPNQYAVFFVSKGYRPIEVKANWHTQGQTYIATSSTSYQFTKMPNACRATISNVQFVNQAQPHVPMIVNATAQLDAQTASAFQLVQNGIDYVPQEFMQEYYGADTRVKMEILQGSSVIHTQVKEFKASTGNSIIAGTQVPVQFIYVPTVVGNYVVRLTSTVIDDQCATYADSSAQGNFAVLNSTPSGQFYTILNNLAASNVYPKINEQVTITYNKISNHADGSSVLTPVQTDVDHIVMFNNNIIYSNTVTIPANPTATQPVSSSFTQFSFTPAQPGVYNVTIRGRANSVLPVTQTEITDEETILIYVNDLGKYNVSFVVKNANNASAIVGAEVVLNNTGTQYTNSNGFASFANVPQGSYKYTITNPDYTSTSQIVQINSDLQMTVVLHPGNSSTANSRPVMNLPDQIQLEMGKSGSINFWDYADDDETSDDDLRLGVVSGANNVSVTINHNTGVVTFTPQGIFVGTNNIRFQLNDTDGGTVQDIVTVNVVSTAASPVWSAVPTIVTPEDNAAVRVRNLRDFVTDLDTPKAQLNFNVVSVTPNSLATAQIVDGSFISVFPSPNQNGIGTIVVQVTDGIATVQQNITLNVTPVNDAPEVITTFQLPTLNSSQNFTLDLTKLFRDPDGDVLTYFSTQPANVTMIVNNATNQITIVPSYFVNGVRVANITAFDPAGLNVTTQLVMNFNIPPTPFLTLPVPNLGYFEDFNQSIDLTPFENDPVEGPAGNGNTLVWSIKMANDTNGTPSTYLSTLEFEAFINQTTDFLLFVPRKDVVGTYNVTLRLTNSLGNFVEQNISVTWVNVNDAPEFVNFTNKTADVGVPFIYNVSAFDVENDTITFSLVNTSPTLAGFSITPQGNINFTPTQNGVHNITLSVCDNFAACNNGTFVLTINDFTAPNISNEVLPSNTVYAPNASYTFSVDVTDNGNLTNVSFVFNGQNVSVSQTGNTFSSTVVDLAAGTYQYSWTATDSANNVATLNGNFTVSKANSSIDLLLNGTNGNITVAQNSNVSISANLTNTSGAVSVFRDGALIVQGQSPVSVNQSFPIQGLYNITATFGGNQNYSASSVTHFITVPDTVAPQFGAMTSSPVSPAQFTTQYNFTVVVTDNVAVDTVTLEIDGTTNVTATNISGSTYQAIVSSLTVGTHSMVWHANDTSSNSNSTAPFNYTVTQGTPVVSLLINNATGTVNVQVNDTVTIDASLVNPTSGTVNIYVNGTLVQSGAAPQQFNTSFSAVGSVQVIAEFPGDANVSAGNVSATINVQPQITATNIIPASGAQFNYSRFNMTWTTPNATTCKWDLNDVNQNVMTGSVVSANGLNHSATIFGYSLGAFNVHIGCNGQSSTNNTDLSYTALNFLDGSTLTGTNSITNTIMFNSTIADSTLTDSVGTRNTLTDVISTQSNISDTTFVNSNSTQSDISLSQIWHSDIQFCTIVNSTFSNATAISCVITNNVITAGEITVLGFTYNATLSGPANLSDIIPLPPVASFTPASGTFVPNNLITFTSTSTDANVGGPLNDSLSFNWTFSDGVNFTNSTFQRTFNTTGVFNVTLVVTDSFGFTSSATGQLTIANPPPSGGGGGGGGGGGVRGGGGGGGLGIELSANEVIREVFTGQPLKFSINGVTLADAVYLRSVSTLDNSSQWIVGGRVYSMKAGESRQFDLNADGVLDLNMRLVNITRTGAFIGTSRAEGTLGSVLPFPLFNFTGVQPEVKDVTEPIVGEVPESEYVETPVKSGSSALGKLFSSLKDNFNKLGDILSTGWTAKIIIMFAVVLVGLAAYSLFIRWERF